MTEIQQYHTHDFVLQSAAERANPFKVVLNATFEHESGEMIANLPGFYDGNGAWKVRFSPPLVGRWTGRTNSEADALNNRDLEAVDCVPNTNAAIHGALRVDEAHPGRFAWEDGTPFVALGFECDWLFSYHQRDSALARTHVDLMRQRGFNYVVMNVYTLNRIEFIRMNDAYQHLVTVRDPEADSSGRNGPVDWACDFVSDQVHLKDIAAYNREAIRRQRIWPTPYLNIEYGYELGVDQLKTYTGGTTAKWEDVLKWTYALYAAGAYANYYYDNTSWDLIKFEPDPPPDGNATKR